MESDKVKRLVMVLLENLKALETELVAHRILFLAMKNAYPIPDLDSAFQKATQKAHEGMDQKYDHLAEKLRNIVDQVDLDEGLEELLKSWNSEGPVN